MAGDAIRGLLSLLVITFHVAFFGATARRPFTELYGTVPGWLIAHTDVAVYPFFVLSGYLLGRPFIDSYLQQTRPPSVSGYAIRRVFRVLPVFWVAFTLMLLRFGTFGNSPWDIASVYLFLQNYHASTVELLIGPAWSLDLEVVFYALLPVGALALARAGRSLQRRGRLALVLGATVALSVLSAVLRPLLPQTASWQISFPAMVFCFTPGIICAALERDVKRWIATVPRFGARLRWGLLALLAVSIGLYLTGGQDGLAPGRYGIEPVLGALVGGALVALALAWEWCGLGPLPPLGSRALHWIGQRAYSLYLIHEGLMFEWIRLRVGVDHPGLRFVVLWPLIFLTSMALAAVVYRLVEKPGMDYGHRLARRRSARRLAVIGA